MKKMILAGMFLAAAQAYGACETEAANYISNKYQVNAIETRDLVGNCGGEGSTVDREVWVKADDSSTYSVFFWGCDCSYVKRDIKW